MEISEIISPRSVLNHLKPTSKKQVLQELAEVAADYLGRDVQEVFDVLVDREKLGSTGVGNGVAIPHGKLPDMKAIYGVFARLQKPVAFESIDDQPVDIVFMLLAPQGSGADHLKALSRIARLLRDENKLASLRSATDVDAIYSILTSTETASAA